MAVFRSVTPAVEPVGMDEAFLDVSGAVRRLGRPTAIAAAIRDRVADEQGITCSVGVASTKFVAKLASGRCKPDGMLVVPATRPSRSCTRCRWGRCGGSASAPRSSSSASACVPSPTSPTPRAPTLRRALGEATGTHLHALAWGRDPRRVVPEAAERSTGAEETFGRDVDDPAVVLRELLRLSERTAARLRHAGTAGRTVVIKVRFADFTTITRSRTLPEPRTSAATSTRRARALRGPRPAPGPDPAGRRPRRGARRRRRPAPPDDPGRASARVAGRRAGRRPRGGQVRVAQRASGLAAGAGRRLPSAPVTAPGGSARGR